MREIILTACAWQSWSARNVDAYPGSAELRITNSITEFPIRMPISVLMTTTHPVKIFQHSLVTRQSYLATNNQSCYCQHNLPHNVVFQNPDNSLEDNGRIFSHGLYQAMARQGCHYYNTALLPNSQICSEASLVRLQSCPKTTVSQRSRMYPYLIVCSQRRSDSHHSSPSVPML